MQNHQKNGHIPSPPPYDKDKNIAIGDGPKDGKEKLELHRKLRECFFEDGITSNQAATKCGCSYRYAAWYFRYLGLLINEAEEHDWLERNDIVRKRALEGISVKIQDLKPRITLIREVVDEARKMQKLLLPNAIDKAKKGHMQIFFQELAEDEEAETFFEIVNFLSNYLKEYANFGHLFNQQIQTEKMMLTYAAELQQQYDAIEIMPPPSAVLELELEKRIADKQKLFKTAMPQLESQKEKKSIE